MIKKQAKLMLGDNMESLKKLPDNSIDSIVTDPPYGLSFMGKKWDYDVPSVEFWKEVYRVLKPGGHILSFGGTRTYHRMVVNIEDSGFEIRDQVMWLYGSGFPKSHNIGKAVDKLNGVEIEKGDKFNVVGGTDASNGGSKFRSDNPDYVKYQAQNEYEGWGTALKPANEPICVARKPLNEKTIADNVIKWGTGGINIDGCRVATNDKLQKLVNDGNKNLFDNSRKEPISQGKKIEHIDSGEGRFPANIILECCCDETIDGGTIKSGSSNRTDKGVVAGVNGFGRGTEIQRETQVEIHTNPNCPCRLLDEQSGVLKSGDGKSGTHKINRNGNTDGVCKMDMGKSNEAIHYGDKGGASRFFYVAKVSKKERNLGLDGFEDKIIEGRDEGQDERSVAYKKRPIPTKNTHPTLKPINLMTYLCRLVTPEGGIVLDPFMGSGSTGISALLEGFRFVGMEMDKDYFKIAEARIEAYEEYRSLLK